MVQAISSFMEFCYLVRRSVLDDNDLEKLDEHLSAFHEDRDIFIEEGIRDGFSLPRQHSLTHYSDMIRRFGAPNGLCSSITESKHIRAVRKPWRRSSKFNALSQMLRTNLRLDKLEATSVDFKARGMLRDSIWANHIDPVPPPPADDDNDGEELDDRNAEAGVKLARKPCAFLQFLERITCNLTCNCSHSYPTSPSSAHSMVTDPLSPGAHLRIHGGAPTWNIT
jgi:hypothetical protein